MQINSKMLYTSFQYYLQEYGTMAESINDIRGQKIKELVKEMKLYNNPQELEDIRKLIKKNVPFMMRGYLLAYLYVTKNDNRAARPARIQNAERPEKRPRQLKPELENATSFYINIGKASKPSAQEMVNFICEKTGISPEDILLVTYKQNYSFIYIRNEKAEGICEAVTGQTYNGRKVKMNFSKDRDEN